MKRTIFLKILLNILFVFGMAVCMVGMGMGAEKSTSFWEVNAETPDERDESFFHRPAQLEDTETGQSKKESVQKQRQKLYMKTVRKLIAGEEKEPRIDEKADQSQTENHSRENE